MLHEIGSGRKTVAQEAIRLTELIINKQVLAKTIDDARAKEFFKRIEGVLFDFYGDAVDLLVRLEAIEAAICCKACSGTGIQTITNGADAGEYFEAAETIKQRCKCCGG